MQNRGHAHEDGSPDNTNREVETDNQESKPEHSTIIKKLHRKKVESPEAPPEKIKVPIMTFSQRLVASAKTGSKYGGSMLGAIFVILQIVNIIIPVPDVVTWSVSLGLSAITGALGGRRKYFKTIAREKKAIEAAAKLDQERAASKAENTRLQKQISTLVKGLAKTSHTTDVIKKHVIDMHEETSHAHHSSHGNSHNAANEMTSPSSAPIMHIHIGGNDVTPAQAQFVRSLSQSALLHDSSQHQHSILTQPPLLEHMPSAPLQSSDSSPTGAGRRKSNHPASHHHSSSHRHHHHHRHATGRHSAHKTDREHSLSISSRHSDLRVEGRSSPTSSNKIHKTISGDPLGAGGMMSPLSRQHRLIQTDARRSSASNIFSPHNSAASSGGSSNGLVKVGGSGTEVLNEAPLLTPLKSAPTTITPPNAVRALVIDIKPTNTAATATQKENSKSKIGLFERRHSGSTSRTEASEADILKNNANFRTLSTELHLSSTGRDQREIVVDVDESSNHSPRRISMSN